MFTLALALRLLFWQSGPDAVWPHSCWYKGDAPTWVAQAAALQRGAEIDLGLPLRPPAMAWWLHLFIGSGHGDGVALAKFFSCLLGALGVVVLFAIVLRSFGPRVALVSALACALSSGLMVLSTTLNNETPYLLIALLTIGLFARVRQRPSPLALFAWAGLGALGCLLRVEHAAFFLPALAALAMSWRRRLGMGSSAARCGAALAIFLLLLLPWHLRAWAGIARYNERQRPAGAGAQRIHREIVRRAADLRWSSAARAELAALPAFFRFYARDFVTAAALQRGRSQIDARDFGVIEEAYGYRPEPLAGYPFIALYGPLNFSLANNAGASGGFSRALLEQPPPWKSDPQRLPTELLLAPRSGQLDLVYPPHLRLVNEGYAIGWSWIRADPAGFLKLLGGKLQIFWAGASMGFGGGGLPIGMEGIRRRADMVVAEGGGLVTLWRIALLLLGGAGLILARSHTALLAWILFALSRLAATVLFFGYARSGALIIPVLFVLIAIALDRLVLERLAGWPSARRRLLALVAGLAVAALLTLEVQRCLWPRHITLDGRAIAARVPWPLEEFADRELRIED